MKRPLYELVYVFYPVAVNFIDQRTWNHVKISEIKDVASVWSRSPYALPIKNQIQIQEGDFGGSVFIIPPGSAMEVVMATQMISWR